MKQVLLVFLGGGVGSTLRFLASKWIQNPNTSFPFSTFLVNILGSLFISILISLASKQQGLSESQTLLLVTGFCGGFTTFSAFTYENVSLIKSGDFLNFSLYTLGSIIFGIAAVYAGLYLSKSL